MGAGAGPAVSWRPLSFSTPLASQPVFLQRGGFRTIIFVLPLASASSPALTLTVTLLADPHHSLGIPHLPVSHWEVQDTGMRLATMQAAGAPRKVEPQSRAGPKGVEPTRWWDVGAPPRGQVRAQQE